MDFRCVLVGVDPLYRLLEAFEQEVAAQPLGPEYLAGPWLELRRRLILHCCKSRRAGSKVRGVIRTLTPAIASAIEQVYGLVLHNRYLSSQYWRGLHRYCQDGQLTAPFGQRDADLGLAELTGVEIEDLRGRPLVAEFLDNARLAQLLRSIRPFIRRQVKSRARFLTWTDPALYSEADVTSELECRLITKLRNEPGLRDNDAMIYGLAKQIVINEIPNLLEFATAGSRSRLQSSTDQEGQTTYQAREVNLMVNQEGEPYEHFGAVTAASQDKLCIEDQVAAQAAFDRAPAEIRRYLDVMWRGDPEFWAWFHDQEPELAAQLGGRTDLAGPWIRRWLNLSEVRLLRFLDETLPRQAKRSA